jgi:NAD(P)H dehydrogenase (quinone)
MWFYLSSFFIVLGAEINAPEWCAWALSPGVYMQHLIVVAHPLQDSITMKLARAYALELQQLGHSQRTHDLYRMGFNPVMGAHELEPLNIGQAADADVAQAQEDLRNADALTMIYPLWWAAMPAMMKGYVDRVFARGFVYQARDGVAKGLMAGKRCVLITLSGSPLSLLLDNGEWKAMHILQDAHIFRSSGFELLEHLHFDKVEPPTPDEATERDLARLRACVRRHFAANAVEFEARGNVPSAVPHREQ